MPEEWAIMRSMARCVLPVFVGPSTAVIRAGRGWFLRVWMFIVTIRILSAPSRQSVGNASRDGLRCAVPLFPHLVSDAFAQPINSAGPRSWNIKRTKHDRIDVRSIFALRSRLNLVVRQ